MYKLFEGPNCMYGAYPLMTSTSPIYQNIMVQSCISRAVVQLASVHEF